MNINQLKCDVVEYSLKNKEEILHWVEEKTCHLLYCERIFNNYPEMFVELYNKAQKDKIKELIQNEFSLNGEEASLVCDEEYYRIIYDDSN